MKENISPKPVMLVIAPMPAFPTSAGNRARLVSTCDFLKEIGFDIDFVYLAHEDQIYRRFGKSPPTDFQKMNEYFRQVFLVEIAQPVKLKSGAEFFDIDAWCPPELLEFVDSYFQTAPEVGAVLLNYAFLSKCLSRVPQSVLRIVDTHDKFAGRRDQYLPFRTEPNFYYTDEASERDSLMRSDIIIAIQSHEQDYFAQLSGKAVHLLMPTIKLDRSLLIPEKLRHLGFIGHGNDANLISISHFAEAWNAVWQEGLPKLLIAGEICNSLTASYGEGIKLLGYVDNIEDFFSNIDLFIAPMLMGTGIKLKVVEALAYGVPVIGTGVAFEGIDSTSSDHRLPSITAIVDRVLQLSQSESDMRELSSECKSVVESYVLKAKLAADDLANLLISSYEDRQILTSVDAPPFQASSPILHRFGDAIFTEVSMVGSPEKYDSSRVLVATEFLPLGMTDRSFSEATFPVRRKWFIENASATNLIPLVSPFAGKDLIFAPFLVDSALTNSEDNLIGIAARAFSESKPHWWARGNNLTIVENGLSLEFAGPSFLMRNFSAKYAYAVDMKHAVALRMEALEFSSRSFATPGESIITARCGDASQLSMSLYGRFHREYWRDSNRVNSIIVLSDGLWGRVDFY